MLWAKTSWTYYTVCPRSSDPFIIIVSYYINWVTLGHTLSYGTYIMFPVYTSLSLSPEADDVFMMKGGGDW